MGKYISCGQYNKNYKYIILGCFFNILVDFIFGVDLNYNFNEILLFPSDGQKILYKHFTVNKIFQYIGIIIFSYVFYKIKESTKSNSEMILIFNNSQDEIGYISILNFLFIITVYVCFEFLKDIFYELDLNIFDFWMFELLVISYINAKMFKLKI